MTGTIKTSENEISEVYKMNVIKIPTNTKIQRIDKKDILFATKSAKYHNVVKMVKIYQLNMIILEHKINY